MYGLVQPSKEKKHPGTVKNINIDNSIMEYPQELMGTFFPLTFRQCKQWKNHLKKADLKLLVSISEKTNPHYDQVIGR